MHACRLREMVRIKAGRETRIPWSSRCDKIRRPRSSRTSLEQTKNRVRFFFFSLDACENMWIWGARRRRFSPDMKQTRVLRCVNEKRGKDPPLWRADGSCTSSKFEGLFEPLSLSCLLPSARNETDEEIIIRERKKLLLLEFCPLLIVPSSIISYV